MPSLATLFAAVVLAALHAPCAFAQDTPTRAGGQITIGDTVVYPGEAAYPAGLAARGVQGRVLVRVTVDAAGKAAGAAISASSRSRELDRAALALARSYPYPPGSDTQVAIRFSKDRLSELPNKTCADFNIDKAWFGAAFPELKPTDMDIVKTLKDKVLFSLPGPRQMPFARASGAVAAAAIAACATRPGATLFALMQEEAAKLPLK